MKSVLQVTQDQVQPTYNNITEQYIIYTSFEDSLKMYNKSQAFKLLIVEILTL